MPLRTLPPMRLTNAKVLHTDTFKVDELSFSEGKIDEGNHPTLDLAGYWILPGIIDLHGDGFEKHLQPRMNVDVEKQIGLRNVDGELAANGVTTAYLAQCWSFLGGKRGPKYAEALFESWQKFHDHSRVDMQLQIRYETHMIHNVPRLLDNVDRFGIKYVVFNNHLPDAVDDLTDKSGNLEYYAREAGRTVQKHKKIIEKMVEASFEVDTSLQSLSAELSKRGVRIGSHDDETAAMRKYFADIGAHISEFPTSLEAAKEARELGNPVIMGAPNVMRGGSQSGNVNAQELIEAGLCDALVSDYYYPAQQAAAWKLFDNEILSFEEAWALISSNPARILGLSDRGDLSIGQRADFVIMNPETRHIEATISNGRVAAASGVMAAKLAQHQAA